MKPKQIQKVLKFKIKRKHDLIREIDQLEKEIRDYTEILKSPKLRKLNKIEVQKK